MTFKCWARGPSVFEGTETKACTQIFGALGWEEKKC